MYKYLLALLVLATACKDKEIAEPRSPISNASGTIYIACHAGPYPLNLDSLILHCQAPLDLNQDVDSMAIGCTYDQLHTQLTENPHLTLQRGATNNGVEIIQVLETPAITEIPIVIEGQEYQPGEYPYLGGFLIEWPERTVTVYMVNRWIGGCFHDLILWEAMTP